MNRGNFIGRDAVASRADAVAEREWVGCITPASRGYRTSRHLALGYVKAGT